MISSIEPINNNTFEYSTAKILGGVSIAAIGTLTFTASAFSLLAGIGVLTPTLSAVTSTFITLIPAAIAVLATHPVGWIILSAITLLLAALTIFGGILLATRKKEVDSPDSKVFIENKIQEERSPPLCKTFTDLGKLLNYYKKTSKEEYDRLVQSIKKQEYLLNTSPNDLSIEATITALENGTFEYPNKPNHTKFEIAFCFIKSR